MRSRKPRSRPRQTQTRLRRQLPKLAKCAFTPIWLFSSCDGVEQKPVDPKEAEAAKIKAAQTAAVAAAAMAAAMAKDASAVDKNSVRSGSGEGKEQPSEPKDGGAAAAEAGRAKGLHVNVPAQVRGIPHSDGTRRVNDASR